MNPAHAFWLVEHMDPILETTEQLANVTIQVLKAPTRERDLARVRDTVKMAREFGRLTLDLMPATLEYSEDMSEADLRAWAARVVEVLRGEH